MSINVYKVHSMPFIIADWLQWHTVIPVILIPSFTDRSIVKEIINIDFLISTDNWLITAFLIKTCNQFDLLQVPYLRCYSTLDIYNYAMKYTDSKNPWTIEERISDIIVVVLN